MTTQELLKFHEDFCARGREIMARKNHDYAGANGQTPFANFESTEQLGITTTEKGLLVRIGDKLKRLVTFCNAGVLMVKDEGAEDACMDILNYAILLAAWFQCKRTARKDQGVNQSATGVMSGAGPASSSE